MVTAASAHAQSVADLNETGWKLLDQGDADRAAKVFADALARRPDEPVLLLGAGISAQQRGESAKARTQLERALQVNPRFTAASVVLGEILYQQGDLDRAIATYEAAAKYSPRDPELKAQLAVWRAEADVHSTFVERRQDRFRVLFEGRTDASLGALATDVLTNNFWRIGEELGSFPSDPVRVILYSDKQFRDITRAPAWSGGLYDGQIRVPVAGASQSPQLFEHVLSHELTHAMVTSIAPRGVPVWLHEGLAQHFDGTSIAAARKRLRLQRRRIPLEQLEGSFDNLTATDAVIAYDESLLAVSAIPERRRDMTWTQLLYGFANGGNPRQALGSFGIDYADLEASFEK